MVPSSIVVGTLELVVQKGLPGLPPLEIVLEKSSYFFIFLTLCATISPLIERSPITIRLLSVGPI